MENNEAYMIPLGNVFYPSEQDIPSPAKQLQLHSANQFTPISIAADSTCIAEVLQRKRSAYEIVLKTDLETWAQLLKQSLITCCYETASSELIKSVITSHMTCLQLRCIPLFSKICATQYLEPLLYHFLHTNDTTKLFVKLPDAEEYMTSAWYWMIEQYYKQQEYLQNSLIAIAEQGSRALSETYVQMVSAINQSFSKLSDTAHQLKIRGQLSCIAITGRAHYTYICNHSDASCSRCAALHNQIFAIEDGVIGTNLPPMHPNCRCEIHGYPTLPEHTSISDIIALVEIELCNRSIAAALEHAEIPLNFLCDGLFELWSSGLMGGVLDSYGAQNTIQIGSEQYTWNQYNFSAVAIDPTGNFIKPENLLQYDAEMLALMRQRDELFVGDSYRNEIETKIKELERIADEDTLSVRSSQPYTYYVLGGDITEQLNTLMAQTKDDYAYMHERTWMENLLEFKNLVQNSGDLDLKNQSEWQHSAFIYNGELLDQDALGNINYGFFGTYCNIPDAVLLAGAGYAQFRAGTTDVSYWTTLFDDPRDTYRILQGIELYQLWYA